MKLRSTFLALASLLLMGSLVSAQTSTAADPAAGSPAFMSSPQASADCAAAAKLPSFEPAPTQAAGTCGPCSATICQGMPIGNICAFQGGRTYRCQNVLGYTCGGAPITHECSCHYGPLP